MYRERDGVMTPTWRAYALSFGLFIVLLVLAYLAIFVIWRSSLMSMYVVVMEGRHWSVTRLIYLLSIVALTIGGFIFVMAAEPYLRRGVEQRDLARRFLRLFVPLLVLTILGVIIRLMIS